MVTTEFTTQLMRGILGIVGNIVTLSTSNTGVDEQKKIFDTHYKSSKQASERYEAEVEEGKHKPVEIDLELSEQTKKKLELMNQNVDYNVDKLNRRIQKEEQAMQQPYDDDMTEEKISGGTACLPCSRDHFTVASSVIDEATRFATRPNDGMGSSEVRKRVQMALKELNSMERIDLAPESTASLQGREKELATWAKNKSADIRHQLTNARTSDDLETVASNLSKTSQKFSDDVWGLAIDDGSLDKHVDDICKDLNGEQKQRCLSRLNRLMDGRDK